MKKINISKIITNSHELHSKIGRSTIPKTSWNEKNCHICDTKRVEYEKHFLLECHKYTYIKSQFQNIGKDTNLLNFLTHQNYSNLETLFLKLFQFKNKIIKKIK